MRELWKSAHLFYEAGNLEEAASVLESGLRVQPDEPNLLHMMGVVRLAQQRFGDAIDVLGRARKRVSPSPKRLHILEILGDAYAGAQQPAQAAEIYTEALSFAPDVVELLFKHGAAQSAAGNIKGAAASYDRVRALNPDVAPAHFNAGVMHSILGDMPRAEAALRKAVDLNPVHADAHLHLATALATQGKLAAAAESFAAAARHAPQRADAHFNHANAHILNRALPEALAAAQAGLALHPTDGNLLSLYLYTARRLCIWDTAAAEAALLHAAAEPTFAGDVFPLLALVDDPALHLKAAASYVANRVATPPRLKMPVVRRDKTRIGYLSADFGNHIMSHLFAGLFELHDRTRFEVIGLSLRPGSGPIYDRIVRACDRFVALDKLDDVAATDTVRALELDIAVDLNGYTLGHRPELFARGLSPIQVQYLGYPGTIGAPFLDYILGDDFVTPSESAADYAETIACLPGTYRITDTNIDVAPRAPTRREAGLPEDQFVFCSFSNSYKITPPVFDVWMRLLNAKPGSILWLLSENDTVSANLRAEATKRGVDPARLIFAERASLPDHMARHVLADLGLDTFPYTGHTTMGDAIWMGLPVVTLAGQSFAARVGAGMLIDAGLPELVTSSLADYEALALRFAANPDACAALKDKLARTGRGAGFFDTAAKTRQIEQVYARMIDDATAGRRVRIPG